MRSLGCVLTPRRRCVPDALTDGFEATGNVVVQSEALKAANAGQGILNNGGRDDLIRSNLCVGWETCISSCDVSRSSACSPLLLWRLGRSLCQSERGRAQMRTVPVSVRADVVRDPEQLPQPADNPQRWPEEPRLHRALPGAGGSGLLPLAAAAGQLLDA